MKLKEKLAKEHAENMLGKKIVDTKDYKDSWSIRVSFEAGFEKCKELILKEFGYEVEHNFYIEAPAKWFKDLGEEEVE